MCVREISLENVQVSFNLLSLDSCEWFCLSVCIPIAFSTRNSETRVAKSLDLMSFISSTAD